MAKNNIRSTSEPSNNPVGSWQRPPKRADKAIKYLVEKYNEKNSGQIVDLSLNALIMIIIRLHDSVRRDTDFSGGYNEMARVIRRHLFNHLNLSVLYKEDSSEDAGED